MAVLIDYIWQTTFCLLFFYGVYWVLLRKEKAFTITRVYLLVTPVIALVCPLISIPVEFEKPGISLNQSEFFRALSEQEAPETFVATYGLPEVTVESTKLPLLLEIKDYVLIAYLLVATLLALRFIWGLRQISEIRRRGWYLSTFDRQNDCLVIPTLGSSPVFSFFNTLFWDDASELDSKEKDMVYGHEIAHIRQKHSWDVVYFQVLSILFWFNPAIHLMRNATKLLHEYLADDQILNATAEREAYSMLIVKQAFRGFDLSLASPFAKSTTLNRILMMKNKRKSNSLRLIAVLPATVMLMGLVSLRAPEEVQHFPDRLTSTIEIVKNKLMASKDSLSMGIKMNKIGDPEHFELIGELQNNSMVVQIGMFQYEFEGIRNKADYIKVRELIDQLRENSLVSLDEEILRPHIPVDRKAFFPGNPGEWEEMILDRIKFPHHELNLGLSGVIEIEFIVSTEGKVIDPLIKKSIGGGLDAQFLEIIQGSDLPSWEPATYRNRKVASIQSVSFGIYPGMPH